MMLQPRSLGIGCLGLIGVLVTWSSLPAIAIAQIIPDNSLGTERSQITQSTVQGAPAELIQGGARRDSNLFHSFSEFNVGDRQRVYFANPTGITNILSRVTGNNPSNILGTLGVNGTANLFLINPNGLLFGPNARLDIRGSFLASTADSLKFDNGFLFSSSNPQTPPLLTVNVPVGLQLGTNPGNIRVQQSELQVGVGQTLALVGGEVVLVGSGTTPPGGIVPNSGNLTTLGGRIELGSVAAGSLVSITPANPSWELGYQGVQQFQDIRLTQAARVNAGGNGGGGIQMQGRRISITDSSQVITQTQGSQAGKNFTVRATELVEVLGNPAANRPSRLATETARNATGNAGSLTIETEMLRVVDGGVISASTFGAGRGGDLTVRAKSVELVGVNPFVRIPSSLVTQVNQLATGNAGNLTIETETLRVADGALISVGTFEVGNGGKLTVQAKSIEVVGFNQPARFTSSLSAQTTDRAIGNAGDIALITDHLHVANRGEIRTTSDGSGTAGNITIQANSRITLVDEGRITSNTKTGQGNITLTVPLLLMRRGSSITTNAAGNGTGGNISINAGFLVSTPNENNDIIANAFAGSGGKITIAAQGIFGFNLRTRPELQRLVGSTNPTNLDPRRLPSNDITAFSQANPTIDTGTVTLQIPDLDPTQGLTTLPTDLTDPSQLIAATCPADRGSSFAITGRGGLPEDPRQPLMGQVIWRDDRQAGGDREVRRWGDEEVEQSNLVTAPIVEAQDWIVDRTGTVVLVARQPQTNQSVTLRHPTCALSNSSP